MYYQLDNLTSCTLHCLPSIKIIQTSRFPINYSLLTIHELQLYLLIHIACKMPLAGIKCELFRICIDMCHGVRHSKH